ncbi:MAG: ComEC/Rec2 family competence protein, partial [Gammaproteobacteria bacterium]|nr:ComEC/Rec2 family competence protein [Gammaproteobacteria bacterium]NIR95386.1 ComEC/Rec2 family competence protein [Gammaproteobacteria bacterium]
MPKLLLAAYATGIVLAYFVAPWEASGLFTVTGILLLLWFLLRKTAFAWVPFLGMLFFCGFINTHQQLEPPTGVTHISRQTNNSYYLVEALVETVEQRAAGGYKILTEARQIFSENRQSSLHVDGKVLLYIKQGEIKVRPGQIIRWRSRLRKPYRFGNPGEFDYPLYLAAKNIYVTAFVNDAVNVVAIENHPARKASGIENLRLELAEKIEEAMPENQAALQQSLLLGMRAGISTGQRQTLAESGIAHLFAISGLHFGLLALLFFQAGKYMYTRSQRLMLWRPPQKVIPLLLIIPLAGYLMLTGNAWATRRAFLMVSIVAGLIVCDRRIAPFNLLAMVGLVLLLYNPLALFQAGFQLSFAGVAGILAWMPDLQKRLTGVPARLRWLLLLFLTTLCATLATAPVLIWHFHQLSPAGLITNLVAIPL